MTDITELAQSLKRRATSANEFGESLYVKADDILALVEALEKAQETIVFQQGEIKALLSSLESRTVKLPTTRLWAGVTECYEKSDVIAAIRAAGVEVSDD
ncbi:hypothetical protein [Klebsiella pneumoniae]|uniref:hypothetical protein n=1 Tax=Klebsiella pneumoniae TaxID=573 RepID=UPI00272F425D|nr:hypothetical protein [Klebsiella pneumoniae]MDP0922239.1 hypothetical protein [Klebsiella pneumoniae]MDP1224766.1 hypothetical protein [Klebsiella pneumoniae]